MKRIPNNKQLLCHLTPTEITKEDLKLIKKYRREKGVEVFTTFTSKDRPILQEFYELQVKNKNIIVVIDMSEIDDKKYDIIKYNIKEFVHPTNLEGYNMSFYFKLNDEYNFRDYYLDYLDSIMDVYKIREIVVGLPEPAEKTSNFFIYKNYKYFELVKEFIMWHKLARKPIRLDGSLYPCMIPNSSELLTIMEDLGTGIYGTKVDTDMTPPADCLSCGYFKKYCDGPHINFYK